MPQLGLVRGHHLFSGLDPEQLQRVFGSGRIDRFDQGQILFNRGQPAHHFFVVIEGQVNLVVISKSGDEKIVDILGPGKSFAEAVMFMEQSVFPLTAIAAAPSAVARFASADYLSMLRESPGTCLRMLGHLSQRLHMRIREIEYLTLESATHRLARLIESRLPPPGEGPAEVVLTESRQELASRLSIKPETLSRILRNLSDCGAIRVKGRHLEVPDRKALRDVLDSQQ